jgi:hypothetical protein
MYSKQSSKYIKSILLALLITSIIGFLLYWMNRHKKTHVIHYTHTCHKCNCDLPYFTGRSKCYDCDKDLARRYCSSCQSNTQQDYLTRELDTNPPNAKLGYVTDS